MKLKEILNGLYLVHKMGECSLPFLCGGVCRDKVSGDIKNKFSDLDITTGDQTVKILAHKFANELSRHYSITKKTADDGHVSIYLRNLKIDFSSNFNVPGIDAELKKLGIEKPTDLQKEMFSRDFTCNSLLLTLDLKEIKDPTGRGVKDIKEKVLRTCLSPELTFRYNTNRIVRVFYLAAKLGFSVDPAIIDWIKKNPEVIAQSEVGYNSERLNKAMKFDEVKTIKLLTETNLWKYIPITESLLPYFNKIVK